MKKTLDLNKIPNKKILNIDNFKDEEGNLIVKEKDGYFELPFYIKSSIFYNDSEYNKFVKSVEKMVRQSDYYKDYISILKHDYGLNHCMILSNIDSEGDVEIEMHHGPLMTLYDVVSLITNHYLVQKKNISTFKIADIVLKEHFNHNIQVIMLSKTVHELVHKGKILIDPKQCIGNFNKLIEKYGDGLTKEMSEAINQYLSLVERYGTSENDLLNTTSIRSWSKNEESNLNFNIN